MPLPGKVAVLPEDVRDELNQKLIKAGFGRCEYHNMTGGIVALHKGVKG